MAYYDHYWNDKWSSSIGYSRTQVDNLSGQTDGSFKIGQYGSVNLLWYPWKSTMFGVEYLYGQREDKNGAIRGRPPDPVFVQVQLREGV